ncbi:hypothetical protein KXW38_001097, partial [Aspergillus fumigatus]
QDRRARERQFMLGDRYSVMASRADYADASSDPDARQWVDLVFHEIMQRPLPDQYELRRDVWRVHVVQLDGGTLGAVSLTRVERWQLPPLQRDLESGDERQQRRRLASQDRHPIIRGAVIRAVIDRHHPKDISDHWQRPQQTPAQ